jgi:hypothetical protein
MLQSCIVSSGTVKWLSFQIPGTILKDAKFTSFNVPMFLAKPLLKKH